MPGAGHDPGNWGSTLKISLLASIALLLLLAACANGAASSDNDKTRGVYGGVTGGWSHP